ncbi:MAG: glycosyltransferase family 2 protein [Candidatus Edwardsbacteria bacterium]|jgi:glycosyltransferase involved in cell wall biosynthesis|nr:glycosyltransferase family 2 protein [Candidatus Edwardsbacteria bacterium]
MGKKTSISVVIPVCNERQTLEPLYRQVREVLAANKLAGEIIFVDDGSSDGSWEIIKTLARRDKRVAAISFRRNFGKAAALTAGFARAGGGIIITMDGDLQDDPAEIPRFIEKLGEGFDLVSGWKQSRQDPLSKTVPSRLFNWATARTSGVRLHDFNCGFKAYRAAVLREVSIYGELHRYIPVLAHQRGYRIAEIAVRHHPRVTGRSKYGWGRLVKGYLDLLTVVFLTRYGRRPGHFFGTVGSVAFGVGLLINIYLTLVKLVGHQAIGQRPLLLLGTLLMILGIQFVSIGLLGEMIAARTRPEQDYSIAETTEGPGDGKH